MSIGIDGTFRHLHQLAADLGSHGTREPKPDSHRYCAASAGPNLHLSNTNKSWEEAKHELASMYAKLGSPR